ncbi:putative ER-golgi SNARE complex subunit [Eremomyces bilateralis CBS 781.70]|uniref:ER-golgi SNARE complex subunit n=1 Tax=Eremomyces bilateralis CBS 781.70 TaxID=1392243 RepID=A0A6G1G9I7_9PEZI|nr:putative ER-golgi SNARE complex subunit [Eremomyces bilateralis CBS 781.70]KAF1814652.1 putative ER-golgi SNARE complex subunit [Eremomyces bilateralis CBS 781.70]
MAVSIQDRTTEFQSIVQQAQRRTASSKVSAQRQNLLSSTSPNGTAPSPQKQRSEFARRAAEIGRGISGTMAKLERLAQLAKRKTLFDDRPLEINELTFIIKQDLAGLTQRIGELQALSVQQHPRARNARDQEGEHNDAVVQLLKGRVQDVGSNFKEVLELRTKNIQASRSRTENFISSVGTHSNPSNLDPSRTDSPLYQTPARGRSPAKTGRLGGADVLSIDPDDSHSALARGHSETQLMLMEEAAPQNEYIQQRGQAIDMIERTIQELGSVFAQLSQLVSEQGEQIERIDANTEDVVDNVQGAQRELLKYWNRVSGNRWLVAKMFGILMIFFLLWVLVSG